MTATLTANPRTPRQRVPRSLPMDAAACRDCGVKVLRPASVERIRSLGVERALPGGVRRVDDRQTEIVLATCDLCSARRGRALDLLSAHPQLRRALGSRSYAHSAVDSALVVLDVLGMMKPGPVDALAASARDLRLMINMLAPSGAVARWSSRFVPTITLGADPDTAAPARWTHLDGEQAQRLRDTYARLLRARTEQRQPVGPPDDGGLRGCGLCGVETIHAKPSQADAVWGTLRKIVLVSVGGQGPDVWAHLCPACRDAVQHEGAMGLPALERALITHLGLNAAIIGRVQIVGARAWATLPIGTAPNAQPWAHESDLDALARDLERA